MTRPDALAPRTHDGQGDGHNRRSVCRLNCNHTDDLLLSVSRGDTETAYAILQAGGTANVLIATLISTLGLLAIPICVAPGLDAEEWEKKRHTTSPRFHVSFAGSLAMLYIVFYMSPVGLLLASIIYAIVVYVLWILWRKLRKNRHKTFSHPRTYIIISICIYVLGLFVYEVGTPAPWFPVQKSL
jgi:hypothetical protein